MRSIHIAVAAIAIILTSSSNPTTALAASKTYTKKTDKPATVKPAEPVGVTKRAKPTRPAEPVGGTRPAEPVGVRNR
jgi:hypothetical protein